MCVWWAFVECDGIAQSTMSRSDAKSKSVGGQPFSDFLRSLEPKGEPPREAFDGVWTALRQVLSQHLRRRGLLLRAPVLLGVVGYSTWTTPETRHAEGLPAHTRDALDELTADAYWHVFEERLQYLRRYQAAGGKVDGAVVEWLEQFLQERQKLNDPLGSRLYQTLRTALLRDVEEGRLSIVEGGPKLDNATVLSFSSGNSYLAEEADLAAVVRGWDLESLADDFDRQRHRSVVETFSRGLAALSAAGIGTFSFKSLIDALKRHVRVLLADLWADGPTPGDAVDPLWEEVSAERFSELNACVERRIDGLRVQQRTHEQLRKVWRFLRSFSLSSADDWPREEASVFAAMLKGDTLPSYRQLSRLLGLRHDRVSQLFGLLRGEVLTCLRELGHGSASAVRDMAAEGSGSEARMSDSYDLRDELRRRTAAAFRRSQPVSTERLMGTPREGLLITLAATAELGIEWLVLDVDATTGRCLLVAVDPMSWFGSGDRVLAGPPSSGLPVVRCSHGFHVPGSRLEGELAREVAVPSELEPIKAHRKAVLAGRYQPTDEEMEVDLDPDYRDWSRTLEGAQREAAASLNFGEADPRSSVRPLGRLVARAASVILLVALGLLAGLVIQQRRSAREVADLEATRSALIEERDQLAETAGELARERARLDAEIRRLGDEMQRAEEGHEQQREELEARIARLQVPEISVPWILVPPDLVRGDPEVLVVPPEARSVVLLLDARPGDRVEVSRIDGSTVWSATIERVEEQSEVLLRLPARLVPPGEYVISVWRQENQVTRLRFDVVRS